MKKGFPPIGYTFVAQALLLGAVFLFCGSAGAQVNLLKNGGFDEAPLGPTNWTVLYLQGGSEDFEIKDRVTPYPFHNAFSPFYDGKFRPAAQKLAHACFSQTVTNLTPDHTYNVSGRMRQDWWKGVNDALRDKVLIYIEVIGGLGTTNLEGRTSVLATTPADPNIDAPYTYPTLDWRTFTAQQKPDAKRNIEIRLHYKLLGYYEWDKCWLSSGFFDDIWLTN